VSANKVVSFLESKQQEDGSYGDEAKDIACYFKSPMMFIAAKKPALAAKTLNYIKKSFMSGDGDFKTTNALKSKNSAYIEYWSYTNGWIVRSANLLGYTDVSQPGYRYLERYNVGTGAGFLTNNVESISSVTDVLTTAHHGLINLEMGNISIAVSAGDYLCKAIAKQPALQEGFYLRRDKQGKFITDFKEEKAPFCFISRTEPNQLHFMTGYPCAYLAILYKRMKNEKFLNAAKAYLDFSLSCDKSVYECNFSHKIAWAASILYECTGDEKYLNVIEKISDFFIKNQQKNGMWYTEDLDESYDQSAEIACWFLEITNNIKNYRKKLYPEEGNEINLRKKKHPWSSQVSKYGAGVLIAGLGIYALYRLSSGSPANPPQIEVDDTARKLNNIR
jgi:hypothetical protein